mmetsp:Transcript_11748/g.13522  ORF Transcript_11748/g.13522 Transcript_11748/m.13522 type:complete len:339 (+) Transcript_11748:154-1170(+)
MFAVRQTVRAGVRLRSSAFASAASSRNASSLIIADSVGDNYDASLLHVVSAAQKIGGSVSVLVGGSNAAAIGEKVSKIAGVDSVLTSEDAGLDHAVAENVTKLVEGVQGEKSFSHILVAATNSGKNILPRIAAKLDVAPVSEILSVESENTFTRPMYAGNAIATVETSDSVCLLSVRTTAFEKAAEEGGSASVEPCSAGADAGLTQWVSDEVVKSDRPEITAADVVVAGGRGLKNGENFEMLYKLADKVNGAVGASRAAVDAGYVPNDMQIGQTGKVCAPNLYVAVGISGAIQHLAGMKDSKCIVSINKDPEAPIFQVSDYGLEADLFNAVPELTEKI